MNKPRIAIFSGNTGWHEERLVRAVAARDFEPRVVSLQDCRIDLGAITGGLYIPGFEDSLPSAALVRAIPDGSFEQVSLRLDFLHALQQLDVLVCNPARAIERTVDKAMTSFLLQRAGIPTPPTWTGESEADIRQLVTRETNSGRKLVLKPLFGNCGRGIVLVDAPDRLPPAEQFDGVYYLQSFVERRPGPCSDWRVFVIADRAVAAMERVSDHWITNRARGARCLPAVLTDELRCLAEQSAAATGTDYAGVDIIQDRDGRYLVLEVNSVPAWRGLQSVVSVDIAELLVQEMLSRLPPLRRPSAA